MAQGYGVESSSSLTPCPWCGANASDLITNSTMKADVMHTKHLGVDAYMLGSIFSFFLQSQASRFRESQYVLPLEAHTESLQGHWGVAGVCLGSLWKLKAPTSIMFWHHNQNGASAN